MATGYVTGKYKQQEIDTANAGVIADLAKTEAYRDVGMANANKPPDAPPVSTVPNAALSLGASGGSSAPSFNASSLRAAAAGGPDSSSIFGTGTNASGILAERGVGKTGMPAGMIPNPWVEGGPPVPGVAGMAKGGAPGKVQGPPGLDRVPAKGPEGEDIRLNKDEYILRPEVVAMLGGVKALDDLTERVTGERPVPGGVPMPPLPEQEGSIKGFVLAGSPATRPGGPDPQAYMKTVNANLARVNAGEQNVPGQMREQRMNQPSAPTQPVAPPQGKTLDTVPTLTPEQQAAERAKAQAIAAAHMAKPTPGAPPKTLAQQQQVDMANRIGAEGLASPGQAGSGKLAEIKRDMTQVSAATIKPGDNVTATGITGKDSKGQTQTVYKNTFDEGSPEAKEYGRAIYSDSFRGATKQGFNEDFAKGGGNYVGDPATGKGVNLGDVGNNSPNARYPGRVPTEAELNLTLQGYAPARENMANAARAQAQTDTMRQYVGKGLSLDQQGAPDQVRDLFNAPRQGENRTQMEFRQNAPAQAAMEQRRALELEAVKAAGNQPAADPNKDPAKVMRDQFFPDNKEDSATSNKKRAWAESTATRLARAGLTLPPNQLYSGLALAAETVADDPNVSPAELEAQRIKILSQVYGVDLMPLLAPSVAR